MGTPCPPPPLIYITGIIVCLMHYFKACLFYCIRQGLTFKEPKVINESCLLRSSNECNINFFNAELCKNVY